MISLNFLCNILSTIRLFVLCFGHLRGVCPSTYDFWLPHCTSQTVHTFIWYNQFHVGVIWITEIVSHASYSLGHWLQTMSDMLQLIWLPAIVHLKLVKTTWRPLIEMYSTISTQCLTNQQRMVTLNTQFIVLMTPYTVSEIVNNLQTYSEITIKYNSRQTNIVSYIHCTVT